MPDTTSKRPFYEDPEYQARVNALLGGPTAPPVPAGTLPPPVPETPDVGAARARLADAKQLQFEQEMGPGPAASEATQGWLERNAPRVAAVIPNTTNIVGGFNEGMSALGALGSALQPQVARRDDRPLSADEVAELSRPASWFEQAVGATPGEEVTARTTAPDVAVSPGTVAATVGKGLVGLSTKEALEGLAADAAAYLRDQPPVEAEGLPIENGTLYWMRVLGTAIAAPIQEAALRAPMPNLGLSDEGLPTVDGVETFSQFLLGVDVGHGQKVRHENPVADYIQGVAERIETGSGLETDFQAAFREKFGNDWANVGWWVGMPIDALLDWEAVPVKGLKATGRLLDAMSASQELRPAAGALDHLLTGLRSSTVDYADQLGARAVEGLRSGMSLSDLPDAVVPYIEAASRSLTGSSAEELARRLDVAIPDGPPTVDVAQRAADEALAGARRDALETNAAAEAAAAATRSETTKQVRERGLSAIQTITGQGEARRAAIELDAEAATKAVVAEADEAIAAATSKATAYRARVEAAEAAEMQAIDAPFTATLKKLDEGHAERVATATAKHKAALERMGATIERSSSASLRTQLAEMRARFAPLTAEEATEQAAIRAKKRKTKKDAARLAELDARRPATKEEAKEEAKLVQAIDRADAAQAKALDVRKSWEEAHAADLQRFEAERVRRVQRVQAALEEKRKQLPSSPAWERRRGVLQRLEAAAQEAATKAEAARDARLAVLRQRAEQAAERQAKATTAEVVAAAKLQRQEAAAAVEAAQPMPPAVSGITHDFQFYDRVSARLADARAEGRPRSVSLERGSGAAAFTKSELAKQTPDQPLYVLRSENGEAVEGGPLDVVLRAMALRGQTGDTVRWLDARAVAAWDARGKIAHDFLFSTAAEEAVIAMAPRAMRQLQTMSKANGAAGKVLFDLFTRGRAVPSGKPANDLEQAVVEGFRLWGRDRTGQRDMAFLPNGAMAHVRDRERLLREADGAMGVPSKRIDDIIKGKGAPMSADEKAALGRAALRYGVSDAWSGSPTAAFKRALRNAIIETIGGEIANVRQRIRGMPAFHDRLLQNLALIATDWKKLDGVLGVVQRHPAMAAGVAMFTESRFSGLAPASRSRLLRMRSELELAADEVLKLLRDIAQRHRGFTSRAQDMAADLRAMLPVWAPVSAGDLALSRRILDADDGPVDGLVEQVLRADRHVRGVLPWLESGDEVMQRFGLNRWARETDARMASTARRFLVAGASLGSRDTAADTVLRKDIDALPSDVLRRVYEDVFIAGRPLGYMRDVLEGLIGRPAARAIDEPALIGSWLVHNKMDAIVQSAMDDLVGSGVAVAAHDPRLRRGIEGQTDVLTSVLNGEHVFGAQARFTAGSIAWAESTLRGMGLEPGHGGQLSELRLPDGGVVVVPTYMKEEIERILGAGRMGIKKKLAFAWGIHAGTRLVKTINLAGWGPILNVGYFAGQFLTMWPTMAMARGVLATVRTAPRVAGAIGAGVVAAGAELVGRPPPRFLHRSGLAGAMLARLQAPDGVMYPALDPSQEFLRTAAGEIFHIDEMVAGARAGGLNDTLVSFESAADFSAGMARELRGTLDPRRLLGRWNEAVLEMAGVFDKAARLASFVDELEQGTPMDEAARRARAATFDFRDLAPGEAKWGRLALLFYAFERKNLDLFMRTVVENPGRIAQQARMSHAMYTGAELGDLAQGMAPENDPGRIILGIDEDNTRQGGGIDPRYRGVMWTSTPAGLGEQLVALQAWMGALRNDDAAMQTVIGKLHPAIAAVLAVSGAGGKIDSDRANRFPPWMMEVPVFGSRLAEQLGVGPKALEPDEDVLLEDPDATMQNNGLPSVWTVGSAKTLSEAQRAACRRSWQIVLVLAGRWAGREGSAQQQARALGLQSPRPLMTQGEEAMSGLLGIRAVPVPTATEGEHRARLRRQSAYDREAGAAKP